MEKPSPVDQNIYAVVKKQSPKRPGLSFIPPAPKTDEETNATMPSEPAIPPKLDPELRVSEDQTSQLLAAIGTQFSIRSLRGFYLRDRG